ncbi:uncharacterized protein LY89DRAFT_767020 [Mollisia scopiformis]|uniref:Zn(2)-C6 fungal-type domain-containing protein n=1 Tax=Mollisia scopiformis TaxID=149040 RepID=A0A132B4L2_MOLSC|nr:uncharacterized protein LY89DRAFT_767020 [Mollisia scopiformis]KUJ07183.1 hypothetical protein LY89DRAFT_767020 [Mollisia scopiformis]
MVGRPGRSKGCITCIKRKVKCDEQRPTCLRCRDSFMICDGYRNDGVAFINEGIESQVALAASTSKSQHRKSPPARQRPKQGSHAEKRKKHAYRSGTTPTNIPELTSVLVINQRLGKTQHPGQVSNIEFKFVTDTGPEPTPEPISSAALPTTALLASVDIGGFREQIWVSYIAQRLFPGSGYNVPSKTHSWILDFVETDQTSVAYSTACCLGAACFTGQTTILEKDNAARTWYCKAIQQLNANLQSTNLRNDPSNIAASLLLGIYELAISTDGYGWICHAGGVGRLIEMRGPEAHQRGLGKRYFMVARLSIISQALFTRRRTFLEQEKWKPDSSDEPEIQKCNTEIFNIFARIPGILEDSDQSTTASTDAHLHDAIVQILADLFAWRWNWEEVHPNFAYETPVTKHGLATDNQGPLFPSIISFRIFHQGRQLILYDTALILMLDLVHTLQISNAPALALATLSTHQIPRATNPLIMPHENISIPETAREILRCIEFHLQGEHIMAGALMLLMPLRVVSAFVEDEREQVWLRGITKRMARECGWRFSEGLSGYGSICAGLKRAIEGRYRGK